LELSLALGEPGRDLVVLAEGNTSARSGPDQMIVKASGRQLSRAVADDFVKVTISAMVALVDDPGAGEEHVDRVFAELSAAGQRPSVEAMLHAVCLTTGRARIVGHTHPVHVNIVLCSEHAERMAREVLFPDQVVVLGARPVFLPYHDPGLELARAAKGAIEAHLVAEGRPPRLIYLANHGIMALGQSVSDVVQVTEMAVKAARVFGGALMVGGPRPLPGPAVERIDRRRDEAYRRRVLAGPPAGADAGREQ
jgi:rhamnose utilization protein RhaD (predicted bifunctional aldolase and dehydrogenase)